MLLDNLEGQIVAGRFRLKSMVGKGGYGAVFEATQLSVGRRCAVKILLPNRSADESVEERFRAEARATSRLTHPNSLVLYDFGVDDETGFLFLATEFLDGLTLHQILKKRTTLTVWQTLSILEQVAGSLEDAHSQELVHRDIKPKNIMVVERAGKSDFVKVIDFGIAKVLGGDLCGDEELTRTGMLVGTPQYMAPEQLLGSGITRRTDQYTMAVVGYRMLIGRNPFRAGGPMETALRHLNDMPLPLRTYSPELKVNAEFEEVFLKALQKSPDRRHEGVLDFVEALRKAAGQEPEGTGNQALWEAVSAAQAQKKTLVLDSMNGDSDSGEVVETKINDEVSDETALTRASLPTQKSGAKKITRPINAVAEEREQRTTVKGIEMALVIADKPEAQICEEIVGEKPAKIKARRSPETPAESVVSANIIDKVEEPYLSDRPEGTQRQESNTTGEVNSQIRRAEHGEALPSTWVLIAVAASILLFSATALVVILQESDVEAIDEDALVEVQLPEENNAAALQASNDRRSDENGQEPSNELLDALHDSHRYIVAAATSARGVAEERAAEMEESLRQAEEEKRRKAARVARRSAPAEVTVTLIPWGTLYVDGDAQSNATRQAVSLPAGSHELTLRQEGEIRARQTVDVQPGESKIVILEAQFDG